MEKENKEKHYVVDSILFDVELVRLVLDKMKEKVKLVCLSHNIKISDIEDAIYVSKGQKLNDVEKIRYECSRIKRFIVANEKYLSNPIYKEVYNRFELCLLKIIETKPSISNYKFIEELKKELMLIEISLGMTVAFYSVVDSLLEDLNGKSIVIKKEYKEVK